MKQEFGRHVVITASAGTLDGAIEKAFEEMRLEVRNSSSRLEMLGNVSIAQSAVVYGHGTSAHEYSAAITLKKTSMFYDGAEEDEEWP